MIWDWEASSCDENQSANSSISSDVSPPRCVERTAEHQEADNSVMLDPRKFNFNNYKEDEYEVLELNNIQ